ncbi:MAG: PDZ domain-containing protein [Candidatus Schekmanbacteria bacterium]|nr:PDZ domain-containing protein [Candidatus Schekmanbacteria bacterium]
MTLRGSTPARRTLVVAGVFIVLVATGTVIGTGLAGSSIYEDLGLMLEVFQLVSRNYVDEVSDDVLLEGAIEGLLQSADGEAVYSAAPPATPPISELIGTGDEPPGVGIVLGSVRSKEEHEPEIVVLAVLPSSPAATAGIRPGDRLVKVGEDFAVGISVEQAYEMLHGEVGTTVDVSTYRSVTSEVAEHELVRGKLPALTRVEGRVLPKGVCYLRVRRIDEHTVMLVRERLMAWGLAEGAAAAKPETLKPVSSGVAPKLSGVVIDLRGTAVGEMDAALALADLMVPDGAELSRVIDRKKAVMARTVAADGVRLVNGALVEVLVDTGTSSAAELFAAALKESATAGLRVEVLGDKTFGHALKRSRIALADGGSVTVATGEYIVGGGKALNGTGLEPDGGVDGAGEAAPDTIQAAAGDAEKGAEAEISDALLAMAEQRVADTTAAAQEKQ